MSPWLGSKRSQEWVRMSGSVDCDMVASVVEPSPAPQQPHREHSTMAKRRKHLNQEHPKMAEYPTKIYQDISRYQDQRTEHRGKTCHDGKPVDDQSAYNEEDLCPCNDKKAGNRKEEKSLGKLLFI